MTTFLKKHLIWILLLGTLIGLNETLVGSMHLPFRSVLLSCTLLLILVLGRYLIPKPGTSLLIVGVAVLFKVNNLGCHHACSSAELLCGPAAVMLMGVCFELLASLLVWRSKSRFFAYALLTALAALTAFGLFALMNTYLLKSWDVQRLSEYILLKGSLTALFSSALTVPLIWLADRLKGRSLSEMNAWLAKGAAGLCIIVLWLFGSFYL